MRRAVAGWLLLGASMAWAQTTAPSAPVLGPTFEGDFDVSFRPFAQAKQAPVQAGSEIARFVREDKKWQLVFNRVELSADTPLRDTPGPTKEAAPTPGYLTITLNKLRGGDPNAEVLRDDILDLGELGIGVMVATTGRDDKGTLLQQAIMQVTPQLYYTLTMTCPIDTRTVASSPEAMDAALTFKGILDSIQRVNRSAIRMDQDDRLIRTRGLFAIWNKNKLQNTLIPERYLRFKRDGKDVGYALIVEQPADAVPKPGQANLLPPDPANASGFRLGVRTHTVTEENKSLDVESWMYVSYDRRHEVWTNVTIVTDPAAKTDKDKYNWFSEVGGADLQRERVFDKNLKHDDFKEAEKKDAPQPFREVDKYTLTVRSEGRSAVADPIEKLLPPWYLPQAIGVLLPRLVPLDNPTGYLFASYSSDNRQLMMRYVDVSPEVKVKLDGQDVRAIGESDKLGLGGSTTTHYMSRRGQYLGSINAEAKVEILPSDRETLEGIWKTLDFQGPQKK
jgi:hypothetical protein